MNDEPLSPEDRALVQDLYQLGVDRDQDDFIPRLHAAPDRVLISLIPRLRSRSAGDNRFDAHREAVAAILQARVTERLRQTMIRLDKSAMRLQHAILLATAVGSIIAAVSLCRPW